MVQESKMNLFPPALGEIRWVLGLGTHRGKPMVVFDLRPMKNKGVFFWLKTTTVVLEIPPKYIKLFLFSLA